MKKEIKEGLVRKGGVNNPPTTPPPPPPKGQGGTPPPPAHPPPRRIRTDGGLPKDEPVLDYPACQTCKHAVKHHTGAPYEPYGKDNWANPCRQCLRRFTDRWEAKKVEVNAKPRDCAECGEAPRSNIIAGEVIWPTECANCGYPL